MRIRIQWSLASSEAHPTHTTHITSHKISGKAVDGYSVAVYFIWLNVSKEGKIDFQVRMFGYISVPSIVTELCVVLGTAKCLLTS